MVVGMESIVVANKFTRTQSCIFEVDKYNHWYVVLATLSTSIHLGF